MIEELREQWEQTPLWQRAFLLAVFPLAMIGVFWFYMIKPKTTERENLLKEKESILQEIDSYRLLLAGKQIQHLERQYRELSEKEREIQNKLMKMVGLMPRYGEFEKVFSLINDIAFRNGVVITLVEVTDPITTRLELVRTPSGNYVKEIVEEEEPEEEPRKGKRRERKVLQKKGVPITYVDLTVEIRGKTENIYGFLRELGRRGIVSFPKTIKFSASDKKGTVVSEITLGVVLRGKEL